MFKINENNKLSQYAQSICDYLEDNDEFSYEKEDFDDFAAELDSAIQNGNIVNIPELDREDAFEMAIKMLKDDDDNITYGDEDNPTYFYDGLVKDTNEVIRMLNESLASRKAKKLGLVHIGFGNYAKEGGESAQYKTVNGKLKKIPGKAAVVKQRKIKKEKPEDNKKDEKKKPVKDESIKNLRRISGEKFTYEFEKGGRKYKFTLSKKERKELKGEGSILDIVKKRLKSKELKKKSKEFKKGQQKNNTNSKKQLNMTLKEKQIIIEKFSRIFELSIIDKAEDIAKMAHMHQKRKHSNSPYFIHPKRVQLLAKYLKYGLDVQIVSLLHDVIEDAKNRNYYYNEIKSKFGSEIIGAISLLSHDKNVPYSIYLEKLAKSNSPISKLAFKVKMLDMTDNLSDAPTDKQKEKYKTAIQNLIDKNLSENIPDVIFKLLGLLNEILQEAPKDEKSDKTPDIKDTPEKSDSKVDDSTGGSPETANSEGPTGATGGDFQGDEMFGDEPDPGGVGEKESGKNEKTSIVFYNDKLKSSKQIAKQKLEIEPGFKFNGETKFYDENYVAQTSNGSLLIAVPSSIENNMDKQFVQKIVLPKIIKVAYEGMKAGRKILLMGDYGLPFYNGQYSTGISGYIAKILNLKFKGNIEFATWNPQDYYAFISNTEIWKELKSRTETKNEEMRAALYLFLLATGRNNKISKKLKTEKVNEVLNEWGLPEGDLSIQINKDEIYRVIFPDLFDNPETLASYIIKTYLQLLRVDMLKKVVQYESKNYVVIVPTDANTSWILNQSFKDLNEIIKNKKPEVSKKSKKGKIQGKQEK